MHSLLGPGARVPIERAHVVGILHSHQILHLLWRACLHACVRGLGGEGEVGITSIRCASLGIAAVTKSKLGVGAGARGDHEGRLVPDKTLQVGVLRKIHLGSVQGLGSRVESTNDNDAVLYTGLTPTPPHFYQRPLEVSNACLADSR